MARLRHWWLALRLFPGLLFRGARRERLREIQVFCRALPAALTPPLPAALQRLTPGGPGTSPPVALEHELRDLADLVALLERRSPLGLCLRRSLTRYHFLRRAGVPVVLRFGARFVDATPDRDVTGHAWLTLNGKPYHEDDENWRGFTVMLSCPPDSLATP